ncbi:hypothetical protein GHT07_03745 [Caenimonas koreensis DSM 17982]|uniref:Uncharacterized protein n=1 Tax=Caenimonas koreensis DSM 17982 TaxID=1121255 RepID=A0A844B504_9BURK|nr:hypothetical protein [Caenimonas koreensis]MRD46376.1 hypothetical protein [Caenimonas koreensis DSM 17982]
MTKTMPWAGSDVARPLSATLLHLLAALLRTASDVLTALATTSEKKAAAPAAGPVEIHAIYRDAGAPEGALYVNGELVGFISGVTRL